MSKQTIKIELSISHDDFDILTDIMNCRIFADESTIEGLTVNSILSQVLDAAKERIAEETEESTIEALRRLAFQYGS